MNKYAYKILFLGINSGQCSVRLTNKWFKTFEEPFDLTSKFTSSSLAIFAFPIIKRGKISWDKVEKIPKPISVSTLFNNILERGGIWFGMDTGELKYDSDIIREESSKYFDIPIHDKIIPLSEEEFNASISSDTEETLASLNKLNSQLIKEFK